MQALQYALGQRLGQPVARCSRSYTSSCFSHEGLRSPTTSQMIRAVGDPAATPYFYARRYFTVQSQPSSVRCQLAYKLNKTFGFTRRPAPLGPCSSSSFCLASRLRCWVCCGYTGRWEIIGIAATEKGHLVSSKKKPHLIYGHMIYYSYIGTSASFAL
jgi:hypothetical protein